jgi:iron complex outermembrane receptor protein
VRYVPQAAKWWAGAYVDNVSDVKVRTNAGRTALGNGEFIYTSQYLPPRTFGVNFGFDF